MNYEVDGSFAKIEQILPFLNDVFIIFFISVSIVFVLLVKYLLKGIPESCDEIFEVYNKFKIAFSIFFALIIITDCLMAQSGDFKFSDPMVKATINTKFALYFFVLFNFLYIKYKIKTVKNLFKNGDIDEGKDNLIIVSQYFSILNIAILIFVVYLKVVIGEFR